jgi:hypothetical protein
MSTTLRLISNVLRFNQPDSRLVVHLPSSTFPAEGSILEWP